MAWSVKVSGSYIEDPFQFFENFTVTRAADTKAGYMRYQVQGSASIYNGGNYYVKPATVQIIVGSAKYSAEAQTPAYNGSSSYTVYVQVPNSESGKTASVQGTICRSGNFTLDTKVVMALSISPATVTAGNKVGLTVTNGNGTALTAVFKYGGTTLATQSFSTGALNYNCPPAWFDTAGVTMLTSMTINVTITGGSNAMSGSFTLQAGDSMKPVMGEATAQPVQGTSTTAFADTYIANYSRAKVAVEVSAPTDAQIAKVTLSYPGGESATAVYNSETGKYEATTAAPITANTAFTMTATDQRGLQSSASVVITGVIPYTPPSVAIEMAYRCDASGNKDSSGEYYRIKATATYYTELEGNSLKKLTAGVKNEAASSISSGEVYTLSGLTNPKKSYTISVVVQDQISEEIRKEFVLEGIQRYLVMTRTDEGTHIGIGMAPEGTAANTTVELPEGGMYLIGGEPIQSILHPVKSLYSSMDSTSPAELFGGSWELLSANVIDTGWQDFTWTNSNYIGTTQSAYTSNKWRVKDNVLYVMVGAGSPDNIDTATEHQLARIPIKKGFAEGNNANALWTGAIGTDGTPAGFVIRQAAEYMTIQIKPHTSNGFVVGKWYSTFFAMALDAGLEFAEGSYAREYKWQRTE